MAKIIIQQKIFSWKDVEKSSEIERLRMAIEEIPDEELMEALESERKGKDDTQGWSCVDSHVINGTGKDKKRADGRYEVTDKTGCLSKPL